MSDAPTPYLLNNAAMQAPARFAALAAMFDPGTKRHLASRGVDRGWTSGGPGQRGPGAAHRQASVASLALRPCGRRMRRAKDASIGGSTTSAVRVMTMPIAAR